MNSMNDLALRLKNWRNKLAVQKGIEPFKILQNKTIEEIAGKLPATSEELRAIKGIGDKKLKEYGGEILKIIASRTNDESSDESGDENGAAAAAASFVEVAGEKAVFSVSEFLDYLNALVSGREVFIRGEISQMQKRDRAVYFSLKDKDDASVVNCFLSRWRYDGLGVELEEGMEVKISGRPEVYKASGRLSVIVSGIEPVGEGALKKAYELLKKKLQNEGLFSRKRPLPKFVRRIGLITSKNGAVIHDFLNNLGKFGFEINFYDARVEGIEAVSDIVAGINRLNKSHRQGGTSENNLDAIVIIRGGGSLESLQAFNNEKTARAIFDSVIPVICGIGHDIDVPIASLAADLSVSTPTAVTVILNNPYQLLRERIAHLRRELTRNFSDILGGLREKTDAGNLLLVFERGLETIKHKATIVARRQAFDVFGNAVLRAGAKIDHARKFLAAVNPERNLKLGYAIAVGENGRMIKSVKDVAVGEKLTTRLSDGKIGSRVENIG
ncbi:MAG: exodeoxyribonuclease VII large subunit [Parcubacteria group bacterium]|nr:exodeoxyribonuclease VII large subunit [Parcubacteria group bacterium]